VNVYIEPWLWSRLQSVWICIRPWCLLMVCCVNVDSSRCELRTCLKIAIRQFKSLSWTKKKLILTPRLNWLKCTGVLNTRFSGSFTPGLWIFWRILNVKVGCLMLKMFLTTVWSNSICSCNFESFSHLRCLCKTGVEYWKLVWRASRSI